VGVAMVLFELLQLARVFLYYLRIEYLWHALIMPLTNRNGITISNPHPYLTYILGDAMQEIDELIPEWLLR